MNGTHRCKCCLRIRAVALEHGDHYYCSADCALAWGECQRDVGLLAAAKALRATEACAEARVHLADAARAIAGGRL